MDAEVDHTVEAIAAQILEPLIGGAEDVLALGQALVQVAARRGFVLTIETRSYSPPAMGSYDLDVQVRASRGARKLLAIPLTRAQAGRRFTSYGRGGV